MFTPACVLRYWRHQMALARLMLSAVGVRLRTKTGDRPGLTELKNVDGEAVPG